MRKTLHVLMNTWEIPLICLQPLPAQNNSAFLGNFLVNEIRIDNYAFERVPPLLFFPQDNHEAVWIVFDKLSLTAPISNSVCGRTQFPKLRMTSGKRNIHCPHSPPITPPPFPFWPWLNPVVQISSSHQPSADVKKSKMGACLLFTPGYWFP